jgi:hypothetical protein
MRRKNLVWIVPLAVIGMALFTFILGQVVKALWNGLLPPLFGFPSVTFWQAVGLLVLSRILFGGPFMQGNRSRWGRHRDDLAPDERERFRQRMRERWGAGPAATAPESTPVVE